MEKIGIIGVGKLGLSYALCFLPTLCFAWISPRLIKSTSSTRSSESF